jgi:hypothetical protein
MSGCLKSLLSIFFHLGCRLIMIPIHFLKYKEKYGYFEILLFSPSFYFSVDFLALLCLHLFEDMLVSRVNFKQGSYLLNWLMSQVIMMWLPFQNLNYFPLMCISDYRRGFGLANRFIGYSQVVTTINYNTIKITVIVTYKWSFVYLLALVIAR